VLNLSAWSAVQVLIGPVGDIESGPIRAPAPDPASLDLVDLALCTAALIALLRFKIGLLMVLGSGTRDYLTGRAPGRTDRSDAAGRPRAAPRWRAGLESGPHPGPTK